MIHMSVNEKSILHEVIHTSYSSQLPQSKPHFFERQEE